MKTKLQSFIDGTRTRKGGRLKPAIIADVAGVSRQHLLRIRNGTADPTRKIMVRIAYACSVLLRRTVDVAKLFDIEVQWTSAQKQRDAPEQ